MSMDVQELCVNIDAWHRPDVFRGNKEKELVIFWRNIKNLISHYAEKPTQPVPNYDPKINQTVTDDPKNISHEQHLGYTYQLLTDSIEKQKLMYEDQLKDTKKKYEERYKEHMFLMGCMMTVLTPKQITQVAEERNDKNELVNDWARPYMTKLGMAKFENM